MDRSTGTYAGSSLEAALQKAEAHLKVARAEIEHEVLLGSDAEGHVLIRARARASSSPVAAFLRDVIAAMGCGAEVKSSHVGETLRLDVVGPDAASILGAPSVGPALRHVLRKAADKLEPGAKVEVSILGETEDRDAFIGRLAKLAIDRCRRYGRPVALPPMNPYERRLVHLTVRESSELTTESVGSGRDRHIVVVPYDGASEGASEAPAS